MDSTSATSKLSPTRKGALAVIAFVVFSLAIGALAFVTSRGARQGPGESAGPPPAPRNDDEVVFLLFGNYSRPYPLGIVLSTRFGLLKRAVDAIPADMSRTQFYDWLYGADKVLETTSRLRVPNLRSDRPVLDGQDIYDGFFAPKPAFYDLYAPLEGSISKLRAQGMTFDEAELKALGAMLRRTMGKERRGKYAWHIFPVGSKIILRSGQTPSAAIWINHGVQHKSVDETVANATCELLVQAEITDPLESGALNRHYNYSMKAVDEKLQKASQGKYKAPRERLYDVVRQYKQERARTNSKSASGAQSR